MRALGAGIAVLGLLGVGAVTASAQLALPTPTPTCLLSLGSGCVAGSSGTTSSATPTPTPLCVLILCGATPSGNPGSTTTGTGTSTPCPVTGTCLPLNTGCDLTTNPNPQCLISPTPSPCQTDCTPGPPRDPGGSTPGGSTPGSTRSTHSTSSSSSLGAGGLGGGDSGTIAGGGATVPLGLSVARVPDVQGFGPGSSLQFGHAPILWPLFGLLDVLGLVAVVLMVRRSRSAEPD